MCGTPERVLSQAWARYFYDETECYGSIDGIVYPGAHDGHECVVVFERAGSYDAVWWLAILFGLLSAAINLPIVEKPVQRLAAAPA